MSVSNKLQLFFIKQFNEISELEKRLKENPIDRLFHNQLLGFKKGIIMDIINKINNSEIMRNSQFNNSIYNQIMFGINNFDISKDKMFSNFNVIDFMSKEQQDFIKQFYENSKKTVSLDVKKIYLKILFEKILIQWLKNSNTSFIEKNKVQEISPNLNSLLSFPQLLNFESCNQDQVNSLIEYFKELNENYKVLEDLSVIRKVGQLKIPDGIEVPKVNQVKEVEPKVKKETETKYKKTKIPKKLRLDVWDKFLGKDVRQGNCYVCNYKIDITDFEAGHILAEVNGGKTNLDNLRPTCKKCNRCVGTMNMDEYKQKYYG
jgi:5-methylcytosine-specific restriction endonuclease McrA